MEDAEYQARMEFEENFYRDCVDTHQDLPEIFHYWSDRYIRPKMEAFGFSSPDGLFHHYLELICKRDPNYPNRFISIGSGNCNIEIEMILTLKQKGFNNFTIDCLDLNTAMLDRGKALAAEKGVAEHLQVQQGDFNEWNPTAKYDAVIANQSLHHVMNLENLFERIQQSLQPDGLFITSDMIGRNGHMRWPEALAIVEEYWAELPEKYKYNHQLKRLELLFDNWDCSGESFEGIRAQDILPLLQKYFHFHLFIGFSNIASSFVDRGFGPNFDVNQEWDRSFIDRIHERDEQELRKGHLKPTHMLAVLSNSPTKEMKFHPPLTPEFCTRWP